MPRKGTAAVKKAQSKYIDISSDSEELDVLVLEEHVRDQSSPSTRKSRQVRFDASGDETVDPAAAREQQKLSNEALSSGPRDNQPRQDAPLEEQSASLANALFPEDNFAPIHNDTNPKTPETDSSRAHRQERPILGPRLRVRNPATPSLRPSGQNRANNAGDLARLTKDLGLIPEPGIKQRRDSQQDLQGEADPVSQTRDPDNMIQGGAYIQPNQQRNMRACMVCSIVRTQQQFLTQGCPNCEELLELAGNPDQINDCTSQVFEGLISVADTNRSWVARYQRLEGYVPGVYATQVEGILPEDVLAAVESAGINYVPRDGSEQEMLGKD